MKNYINGMAIPSGMSLDEIVAETIGSTDGAISHKVNDVISQKKGRFHKAFDDVANRAGAVLDYAAGKAGVILNKSGTILSGVGLAALVIAGSADVEAQTKCTNPVIDPAKCSDSDGEFCLSRIVVTTCYKEKLKFKHKTEAEGVYLKHVRDTTDNADNKISIYYLYVSNPKNRGYGKNMFDVRYLLINNDGLIVLTKDDTINLPYNKNRRLREVAEPKLSYTQLPVNKSEWFSLLNPQMSASLMVCPSATVDALNYFFLAYGNAYNDFRQSKGGVGFGVEKRDSFRTVPIGGGLLLGVNSVDFFDSSFEAGFMLFGDELGNGSLDSIEDFEYKGKIDFVFNSKRNGTGLLTLEGETGAFFDAGKFGSFYLLGAYGHVLFKHWVDVPEDERMSFYGDNYSQVTIGPKVRAVITPLYDLRLDIKPGVFFIPTKESGIIEGLLLNVELGL
ncbi:hypothetical protein HY636_05965 [Candidatus Woesearchaeota archaeon]|nr:hypothetical protein [Candidatus Woesearchaeota archaeon]